MGKPCVKNRRGSATDHSYSAMINAYKQRAWYAGLQWCLSDAQAIALFDSNCHYCGMLPMNRFNVYMTKQRKCRNGVSEDWARSAWIYINGIDRKDNDSDYTPDNTVACCKTCNFAKRDIPYQAFIMWLNQAMKFRVQKCVL